MSSATVDRQFIHDLGLILDPGRVLEGASIERAYDCDAYTIDKSPPSAVVLPVSTEEVRDVVGYCIEKGVPFTPRGAGTGLSGGALPALGGVVIASKRMTQILSIDIPNRRMTAQTGAVNKRLSEAVAHAGLHFAPDPSSQTVSTLGGNIAENSGGPHTLKYGVTANHVVAVKMVDPRGVIRTFGTLTTNAPGYDLVSILVGSEGTLGIITEATIKLTPNPTAVATLLIAFAEVRQATETVAEIISRGVIPAAMELMDHGILDALRLAFDFQYPQGSKALLLIELDSTLASFEAKDAVAMEQAIVEDVCQSHHALEIRVAASEAERAHLWTARKKGIGAMGRLAPTIVTHDGVIPRSKLPEMLDFVYATAAEAGIGVANLFHAGDGNLHPCLYFDDRDPAQVERAIRVGELITHRCVELGGSISGEHGIGVEKLDLMHAMFSPNDLLLQSNVRQIFNTGSLCNPCKVIPNQKSCVEHRKRWRGAAW